MMTEKEEKAEKVTAWIEEIDQEKEGEKGSREIPIIEDIAGTEKIPGTIEVPAETETEIRDQETMIKAEKEEEEEIMKDQQAEDVLQIEGEEILGVIKARTEKDLDLAVKEEVRERGLIVMGK